MTCNGLVLLGMVLGVSLLAQDGHRAESDETFYVLPKKWIDGKQGVRFKYKSANSEYIIWTSYRKMLVPFREGLDSDNFSLLLTQYQDFKGKKDEVKIRTLSQVDFRSLVLRKSFYDDGFLGNFLRNVDSLYTIDDIELFVFVDKKEKGEEFWYLPYRQDTLLPSKTITFQSAVLWQGGMFDSRLCLRIRGMVKGVPVSKLDLIFQQQDGGEVELGNVTKYSDDFAIVYQLEKPFDYGALAGDAISFISRGEKKAEFPHCLFDDMLKKSTRIETSDRFEYVLTYFESGDFEEAETGLTEEIKTQVNDLGRFILKSIEKDGILYSPDERNLYIEIIGYADDIGKNSSEWGIKNKKYASDRANAVGEYLREYLSNYGVEAEYDPKGCDPEYFQGKNRNVEVKIWLRGD